VIPRWVRVRTMHELFRVEIPAMPFIPTGDFFELFLIEFPFVFAHKVCVDLSAICDFVVRSFPVLSNGHATDEDRRSRPAPVPGAGEVPPSLIHIIISPYDAVTPA